MDVFFDWRWWLIRKYNTIWDKFSDDIKKEFDSEPVCNKNILKTKIRSHVHEYTDFYDKKVSKLDSNHACLAVIGLDYALNNDDNYYPQVFLKCVLLLLLLLLL